VPVRDDRNQYIHDVRVRLGIPDSRRTPVARAAMAWAQTEGGATFGKPWHGAETDFNLWNTTRVYNGSTRQPGNSVPVQVYKSRSDGVTASVLTLSQSNMASILKAMKNPNASAHDICKAIYQSPWGTGTLIFDVLHDIVASGMYEDYNLLIYPQTP